MEFQDAYNYIRTAHRQNQRHVTKGYALAEMTDLDILKQASGELLELQDACTAAQYIPFTDDIKLELGDTLSCLIHLAIKHDITLDALATEMVAKLKLRFAKEANAV